MRKRLLLSIPLAIVIAALAAFLTSGFVTSRTPIVIAVEEQDPFQQTTVNAIADGLRTHGYTVAVRTVPASADKAAMVNDPHSDVTLALSGSSMSEIAYPNVVSLGTVAAVPLIPIVRDVRGKPVKSPQDLRGRIVAVDPPGTNRRVIELAVLQQYGITLENTSMRYLDEPTASARILNGEIDAMFLTTLDPPALLLDAIENGSIRLVPTPEAQALAARLGTEYQATLPQGGLSIERDIPPKPESIVVSALRVIANSSLQDGAAYTIAQVLNDTFAPATMFTQPGDLPWLDGVVPSHPAASDYYANGEKPWQFSLLPNMLADRFALLLLVGSVVLLIANLWGVFLPDALDIWRDFLRPRFTQ